MDRLVATKCAAGATTDRLAKTDTWLVPFAPFVLEPLRWIGNWLDWWRFAIRTSRDSDGS